MKKKGFTLIELLAVIIILAIIALIATPIVLNVIDDVKRAANQRNVDMYLHAVDLSILDASSLKVVDTVDCDVQSNGNLLCDETEIPVVVNGTKPTEGRISFVNGNISEYILIINGREYRKGIEPTNLAFFKYTDNYDYTINHDTCISELENKFNAIFGSGAGEEICSGMHNDKYGDFLNLLNYMNISNSDAVSKGLITMTNDRPNGTISITEYTGGGTFSHVDDDGYNYYNDGEVMDVVIPSEINGKKVTMIAPNAFSSITYAAKDNNRKIGINSIRIPSTITSIGWGAFNNNQIKTVIIENGTMSIGKEAFIMNPTINLTIGKGVTYIGGYAFGYTKLTSVTIPSSVTTIEYGAFSDNPFPNAEAITIEGDITRFDSIWRNIGFPVKK